MSIEELMAKYKGDGPKASAKMELDSDDSCKLIFFNFL